MRVTAQTKEATRKRILEVARRLFAEKGYEETTTRDIARAAGIASGTLFNYFPSKEAVVAQLAGEALAGVGTPGEPGGRGETLEEDLFALVAAGLRKLKPLRRHLPVLLETSLSPLAVVADGDAASLRTGHLEAVGATAAAHGFEELSPTALQLYWTLYTGVLVFWANDKSPRQEDTLALIDDSLNMFVGWLRENARGNPAERER
jgi:AcrR family transcriptional regulator